MLFERYAKRGVDFLGVKYPLIAGGMTWVSNFELCKAVSDNGAFPVLADRDVRRVSVQPVGQSTLQTFAAGQPDHHCHFHPEHRPDDERH